MGLFDAIGGFLGTDKSEEALSAQQAATDRAAAIQKEMYEQSRADLQPWRQAGETSLGKMQDADFQRDFTMADFQADPGYAFRMGEANKALERSAAARGGLMGGGTLKGLASLNQGLASQEYGAAYDRFNSDRDRRFGRLSNLAGMGQASASQQANSAMGYGASMSDLYTGLGNAQAAAYIGQGNQNAAMFNGMVGAAGMALGGGLGGGAGAAAAGGGGAMPSTPVYQGGTGGYSVGKAAGFKFSDRRLKTDIETLTIDDISELRAAIRPFKFRYKDPEHGEGDFVGPMAQDIEKSKLGRLLVEEDENGHKIINTDKAVLLLLAALSGRFENEEA